MCITSMTAESDSSDSDVDEKERLCSAVWEPKKTYKLSVDNKCEKQKVTQDEEKRSLRENNTDTSDEDYRSLKITPGFRKHVAEKLETFLDSTITESVNETKRQKLKPCESEGLLLFSTSNPIAAWMMSPPLPKAPVRKRQASSGDSDSEEENLRLSSVAVDGVQIMKESNLLMSDQKDSQLNSSKTASDSEDKHKVTNDITGSMKRKKKKKKKKLENDNDEHITAPSQLPTSFDSDEEKNTESKITIEQKKLDEQIKKHKKKKKERDKNHGEASNLLKEDDNPEITTSKISTNISESNKNGDKSDKNIEQDVMPTKKKKKKKTEK